MKHRALMIMLVCEAALIFILVLLTNRFPGLFSSMMAFPFEQVAIGIKALSQTGRVGNGLAAALWVGISLLPLVPALRYRRNKAAVTEKIALCSLSCVLLLTLYGMINPHVFCPFIPEAEGEYLKVVRAIIGVSAWSVIVLCVVLRIISKFRLGDKVSLLRYLRMIFRFLCLLFAAASVISLGNVLTASDSQKVLDSVISVLRAVTVSAPYILDIAIIISALDLFDVVMTEDQDGIVNAAEKLSRICCAALGATAALSAAFNVLQIILMRRLTDVAATVEIPVTSIMFAGVVLLLSRLLVENKQLRDDISLFI